MLARYVAILFEFIRALTYKIEYWITVTNLSLSLNILKIKLIQIQNRLPYIEKQPPEVFCKKMFLKDLQISQENTCARVSFLINLQV